MEVPYLCLMNCNIESHLRQEVALYVEDNWVYIIQ